MDKIFIDQLLKINKDEYKKTRTYVIFNNKVVAKYRCINYNSEHIECFDEIYNNISSKIKFNRIRICKSRSNDKIMYIYLSYF